MHPRVKIRYRNEVRSHRQGMHRGTSRLTTRWTGPFFGPPIWPVPFFHRISQAPYVAMSQERFFAQSRIFWFLFLVAFYGPCHRSAFGQTDPLPSWNDGISKETIVAFVANVTAEGTESFVPVPDRIAVFDNDGTLWPENPVPFQAAFAFSEIKRMLPANPTWKDDAAVQALMAGDAAALTADGMKGLFRILSLTHAGITTEEFDRRVEAWTKADHHPQFGRPYIECVYQPMLELLAFLRANGFKTYIASAGGMDFMRVWSDQVYGIPPEQVLGSHGKVKYELRDGKPVLIKSLDSTFVDDKAGKPVAIHQFIGRRPIAAFGNSDGDQQMIQYTTIDNPHPSLGVLIHHTDADREYAYDKHPSSSGKLTVAYDEAIERGWTIVDMKTDWNQVFPASQ